MGKEENFWIIIGAVTLGFLLLKALFDPDTKIQRCPTCNLVIRKGTNPCPRCKTGLEWY